MVGFLFPKWSNNFMVYMQESPITKYLDERLCWNLSTSSENDDVHIGFLCEPVKKFGQITGECFGELIAARVVRVRQGRVGVVDVRGLFASLINCYVNGRSNERNIVSNKCHKVYAGYRCRVCRCPLVLFRRSSTRSQTDKIIN